MDEQQQQEQQQEQHHEGNPGVGYLEDVIKQSRRDWMFNVGVALNALAGALLAVPIIGFAIGVLFKRSGDKLSWVSLGHVDYFPERQTRLATYHNPITTPFDGQTADIPCYVRRLQGTEFQVFSVNCTHLGCAVRWFQQSGLFLCPCHGGVYYADGSRAAGPPPRGLYEYDCRVENGELQIKAGRLPTLTESAS